MMTSTLTQELIAAGPRLVDGVLLQMLQNPFWTERFGKRAHTHGREDGLYHITYLCNALEAGDAGVMENYARWLQQVLTTRGMCTRHLADNFDLLAAAIREEPWPGKQAAIDMLGAGTRALRYQGSIAGALQELASRIAKDAAEALYMANPAWPAAGRARCIDDLLYHLSYLADSVELGLPRQFAAYIGWISDFLMRRSVPREHVVAGLDALESTISRVLPAALEPTRPAFAAARSLGSGTTVG